MEPARNNYDKDDQPVTRPNLRALEGGGETSEPKRGHLRSAPNNNLDDIRASEEQGGTKPGRHLSLVPNTGSDGSLYRADDDGNALDRAKALLAKVSRRKKIFVSAGAGGLTALIIAIITLMPLYRIPALMNGVMDKTGEKVQDVVEKRLERMAIMYLIERAGGTPSGNYVITGSPLHDLYASWRTYRLEERVFQKTGFRLVKVDGVVRLTHDGRVVSNQEIKGYDDLMRLSQQNSLDGKDLKLAIRSVIRNDVPGWRLMKTAKFRDWAKIKYTGGKPYGTVKYDKEKTQEENVQALRTQQIETVSDPTIAKVGDAFDCMLSDKCDAFDEGGTSTPPDGETDAAKHDREVGSSEAIKESVNEAAQEAKQEAIKDPNVSFSQRLTEKIATKLFGKVAGQTVAKSLPFVGWIDMLATLQHMVGTVFSKDLALKVPVMLAEGAYGAIYTQWLGFGDQIKAGEMDPNFVSALTKQLTGAEKAQTYKLAYQGDPKSGEPISQPVNSDKDNPLGAAMDFLYGRLGLVLRAPLEAWYFTVGKLLGLIGDVAFQGIGWLLNTVGITALAGDAMKAVFGENWQQEFAKWSMQAVLKILAIDIDPTATGAKLFNSIYIGGDVVMNAFCQQMGCRALTPMQHIDITGQIEQEKAQYLASLPLKDRLFSLDQPNSLANKLIIAAPSDTSPQAMATAAMGYVRNIPGSLLAMLSGRTFAAVTTPTEDANVAGVRQYGALPQDLAQDIAPQVRQQTEPTCPEVPEGEFNLCKVDMEVIQSALCMDETRTCPGMESQDPSATQPVPAAIAKGDAKDLAKKVLENNKIKLYNKWAREDVINTMEGRDIVTCGVKSLNPALLQLLLDIVDPAKGKFSSVEVGYFVSARDCDGSPHSQGRAMDITGINGRVARADNKNGADGALSRSLAEFMAAEMSLSGNGGIGQDSCEAFKTIEWPAKMSHFADDCSYIHADVRGLN